MADDVVSVVFRKWGFWGVLAGALALALVFYQIAAPMTEPKPSVGTQIGEIAGDMRRAAWRSFFGGAPAQPEPVPADIQWQAYMAMAAPALGALAVVLSVISGAMRENWHFSVYGTGLGVAAIVFHFFWWIALLFAGVLLLIAIMENMSNIFGGGWFDGWFGG